MQDLFNELGYTDIDQELWRKEWQGMPEFIQEDKEPYRSLLVHFESEKDFNDFQKLVEQKLTAITKYIWYPKLKIIEVVNKKYIDESSKIPNLHNIEGEMGE